jgi:2-polyprenyl-3-methyl-5-hydroxy-6-metoxy-1,4-benzoquinol methylase
MFGSIYARHPEVLRQSLDAMNESYRRAGPGALVLSLQRTYIRLLGVPEIGFRLRAQHFKRTMQHLSSSPKRVLDAGSGIGAYAVWLAKSYPLAKVTGCDIDETKTAFCNRLRDELHIGNLEFLRADVTRLDQFGDPFDLVVCIDVLEHVAEYQDVLRAFYKVLRPGAYLYVHTPQLDQQRLLKRFDKWCHEDHVREGFAPLALAQELERQGFVVQKATETFGFLGKLAWELNHLTLGWNFALAGAVFPLLRVIGFFDGTTGGERGLGLSILAQKPPLQTT